MTTPHVALNCLLNCPPSGSNLTIQRLNCRFPKITNLYRGSIQPTRRGYPLRSHLVRLDGAWRQQEDGETNSVSGGVRRAAASTTGKNRAEFWFGKTVRTPAKCLYTAGESAGRGQFVDTICEGVQEQSRFKFTNELGRFIEVDTHEAAKTGDLENSEAIKVVKPMFNKEIYQNARHHTVVRAS